MERVLLLCVPAMFGSVTSCTVLKWCFAFVFWGGFRFCFVLLILGGLGLLHWKGGTLCGRLLTGMENREGHIYKPNSMRR